MKKTLLGVLAFILVLATVLTGTVLAADDATNNGDPQKVADVKKVSADTPIKVDGLMDKAYGDATPLEMATYKAGAEDIYTHGIARFVWSEAENALYCFIIVNDADVGEEKYDPTYQASWPWIGDTIELFVDFTSDGTTQEGWGVTPGAQLSRSFQYRINGNDGTASCYLKEAHDAFKAETSNAWKHPITGQSYHDSYNTYHFNNETQQFENAYGKTLDGEDNLFGWHASEDETKQGWGWKRTDFGYTVEYRIEANSVATALAADQKVKFDIQANDCYAANRGQSNLNFFYNSSKRVATEDGSQGASVVYYDWLVLSDEEADNTGDPYSLTQLEDFGMADATTSKTTVTTPRPIVKTDKKTWTRKPTSAVNTGSDTPGGGDNTQGGGDNTQGGGDTTGGGDSSSGGCGSSITVGASLAAVALVGAAGFFAFRKKDEE